MMVKRLQLGEINRCKVSYFFAIMKVLSPIASNGGPGDVFEGVNVK